MATVSQISSTVDNIRKKVRRLTASPSPLQLSNEDLDQYINSAYSQDIPANIKSTLFKEVVEVFVEPNVDRYALSGTLKTNAGPNTFESVRDPIFVEGFRADFYKDRGQFYGAWPKVKTLDVSLVGTGAETSFTLSLDTPVLQREITIGVDIGGVYTNFEDDGDLAGTGTGKITKVGDTVSQGTVVYSTGEITLNFTSAPTNGAIISIWYYTYSTGRPRSVMYWKDELVVRPVPDRAYKVELEAYRYPTQFTDTTDTPTLNQWWEYISILAAIKILSDRQDMEGVANLEPFASRQERLIRNRIANDQIGQRNATLYSGSSENGNYPYIFGGI